jgi:hypothetical protein
MREYPAWIAAYLVHYFGSIEEAQKFKPVGIVRRCPRHGPGTCARLGYWFREETPNGDGLFAVVWDGKTPADRSAIEYGMVDPDRPYGIDLCVTRRDLDGYFSCGWCGAAKPPPLPRKRAEIHCTEHDWIGSPPCPGCTPKRRAIPAPPASPPEPVDEVRRAEIQAWAEKLDRVNPAMAAKVRMLVDLPPPRR